MGQDNTILIKKESKIKSTYSIQDKMNQNDIVHIKKESKTVTISNPRDIGERTQCSHCWANPIQSNTWQHNTPISQVTTW